MKYMINLESVTLWKEKSMEGGTSEAGQCFHRKCLLFDVTKQILPLLLCLPIHLASKTSQGASQLWEPGHSHTVRDSLAPAWERHHSWRQQKPEGESSWPSAVSTKRKVGPGVSYKTTINWTQEKFQVHEAKAFHLLNITTSTYFHLVTSLLSWAAWPRRAVGWVISTVDAWTLT